MPDCRLCAYEGNRVFLLVGAASDQEELNEIIETTFFRSGHPTKGDRFILLAEKGIAILEKLRYNNIRL